VENLALEESKEETEELSCGDDADSPSSEGPSQVSCGLKESISDLASREADHLHLE